MSTIFITCHYFKNSVHKVRYCKRKLESDFEMEKTRNSRIKENVV